MARRTASSDAAPSTDTLARARRIYQALRKRYPKATCALVHRDPWQLLVATILSAQCTDERVNRVTPDVFKRWPTPADMACATQGEVEAVIRSTGFYRNKAKSLIAAASDITDKHGGAVPATMHELLALHGVARKTANVVLGNAFGINEGVVVDTHIKRLAHRMGLTPHTDPVKIERDLMRLFHKRTWTLLSHLLIWHGRRVCNARKPDCTHCDVAADCPKIGVKCVES